MTMQDDWTGRLSEYLDDELTPAERRSLELHLAGCADCTATLDELTRVVERARTLTPRPPQADLWNGIGERIGASAGAVTRFHARDRRRVSFTLPQLAAASLLLAALSAGAAWRLHSALVPRTAGQTGTVPADGRSANDARGPDAPFENVRMEPVGLTDAQYDSAVADLQRALNTGRGHLDPATVAIVEQNLTIIDRALDQARQAVVGDPGNSYLTNHLVETRRKKLELLRRAAALASETN
jgi:anti-sigma factor RsiW